jgi:tetratricopeptide (TPR) repeat protein
LGAAYETQGLTEAAGREYEAALRLRSDFIPAHIAQGNLAFARGDSKRAAACYRRALRLDRAHAGANNNLAMVYLTRGEDLDAAERYARTALERGGRLRPYVLDTLASICVRRVRLDEARKLLDEADAAAPADDTALRAQLAETRKTLEAGSRDEAKP